MRLPLPRRSRLPLAALAFAYGLALLQAAMVYTGVRQEGGLPPGATFGTFARWQLLSWSGWALLAPLVLALGTRLRPERPARWLALHLPCALAASALSNLAGALATRLVHPWGPEMAREPFAPAYLGRWTSTLHLDLILYFAILGAGYAVDYYRRFRERELRAAQLESRLAQARLETLRLQLQPHFLFNTLHAVGGLIRQGESEAAIETLTRLSDLLRVTLAGEGRPLVPLGEELAHTDLYLEIQRIRFADRLSIEREVEPGTEAIPVPAFILQPLVENAIRHGIARKAGAGRLRLTARREGERLRLEVRDDGVGIAAEEPAASGARAGVPSGSANEPGAAARFAGVGLPGVGLANTRERLVQLYGDRASFELLPDPEGGTVARLLLPLAEATPAEGAA